MIIVNIKILIVYQIDEKNVNYSDFLEKYICISYTQNLANILTLLSCLQTLLIFKKFFFFYKYQ